MVPSQVSINGSPVAPTEDLSAIRPQLETLHGVVERLLSNGTLANPIHSIGAISQVFADLNLAMSGHNRESCLSAKKVRCQ